jgi:thiol-disulfide isomerase/thioredoxin
LEGDVDPLLLRAALLVAAVAASVALVVVLRRRDGRVRAVAGGVTLSAADVGRPLGAEVTFVQFTTRTCTSCRAVRRLLDEQSATTPGVAHVEIDAEERIDLARRFHVLRTPTVLVLDGGGRLTARFSGVPTPDQVRDAVLAGAPGR